MISQERHQPLHLYSVLSSWKFDTTWNCRIIAYLHSSQFHSVSPSLYFFIDAKITGISNLSSTVKGYKLEVPKPSTFKAGQWIDLFIPGVEMVGGFSMCSSPSELEKSNALSLAVKYSEWPPANWLHTKTKEEDWVSLRFGGDYHYPDKDTDLVKDHSVSIGKIGCFYFSREAWN